MSEEDRAGHRADERTLAERLRELFDTVQYQDARGRWKSYTAKYVAQSISEDPRHDTTITLNYLDALRNGRHTNPTGEVLQALVQFFNDHRPPTVPLATVDWLLGSETERERQVRSRMRDERVGTIAMRTAEMDDELQDQVLDMLDILKRNRRGRENGSDAESSESS